MNLNFIPSWICENYEWLFSGVGVYILTIMCNKIFFRKKDKHKNVIHQNNYGNNVTIIGIQNNKVDKDG